MIYTTSGLAQTYEIEHRQSKDYKLAKAWQLLQDAVTDVWPGPPNDIWSIECLRQSTGKWLCDYNGESEDDWDTYYDAFTDSQDDEDWWVSDTPLPTDGEYEYEQEITELFTVPQANTRFSDLVNDIWAESLAYVTTVKVTRHSKTKKPVWVDIFGEYSVTKAEYDSLANTCRTSKYCHVRLLPP